MRILYVSDLHGDTVSYEAVLRIARSECVDAVVNGGDMYPKDGSLEEQHIFINGFLRRHLAEYARAGIPHLCMPGNDDLAAFDGLFDSVCCEGSGIHSIAQRRIELGGYEFIGCNLIADYQFRLKDRCRRDADGFRHPPQLGTAVVSDGSWPEFRGLRPISDWSGHAQGLPTLADELDGLERPRDPARTVYVIHMPPSGLGLDVCHDDRQVGSLAVRRFLGRMQPRISLHGHIHESPRMTGVWRSNLGQTVVVQPGQGKGLVYVITDLDTSSVMRAQA